MIAFLVLRVHPRELQMNHGRGLRRSRCICACILQFSQGYSEILPGQLKGIAIAVCLLQQRSHRLLVGIGAAVRDAILRVGQIVGGQVIHRRDTSSCIGKGLTVNGIVQRLYKVAVAKGGLHLPVICFGSLCHSSVLAEQFLPGLRIQSIHVQFEYRVSLGAPGSRIVAVLIQHFLGDRSRIRMSCQELIDRCKLVILHSRENLDVDTFNAVLGIRIYIIRVLLIYNFLILIIGFQVIRA